MDFLATLTVTLSYPSGKIAVLVFAPYPGILAYLAYEVCTLYVCIYVCMYACLYTCIHSIILCRIPTILKFLPMWMNWAGFPVVTQMEKSGLVKIAQMNHALIDVHTRTHTHTQHNTHTHNTTHTHTHTHTHTYLTGFFSLPPPVWNLITKVM